MAAIHSCSSCGLSWSRGKQRNAIVKTVLLVILCSICARYAAAWQLPVTRSTCLVHRTRTTTTTALKSTAEEKDTVRPDLPDFGKTTVEVDKIKLTPKQQKWRRKDLFGSTLVDQTLQELETDQEFQETAKRYETQGAEQVTKEERTRRRRALDALGVPSFSAFLKTKEVSLTRRTPKILQINIGLYCNQACAHCHVESSPLRTQEMMTAETAAQCLELLKATPSITTLDITGGAPELNNHFRFLVQMARQIRPDLEIIDRCNLTVLQEPGQEDLVQFLAAHRVRIIASLPCYSEANVDQQRGHGVFDRSIAALLALNEAGYGVPAENDSDDSTQQLPLDLVYNPLGAFLPPAQDKLEVQYKAQLQENFGILFNSLFTITNMPIKRFADFLHRREELRDYMELLVRNFNVDTVENIMCVDTVNVGYDGTIYDCDFNQQLGYGVGGKKPLTVFDLDNLDLTKYPIRTDNHCFGCTAGMGSS